MFDELGDVPRLLMQVELRPVQGDRFQPTGFADLGAAVYERPDGKRMLLVESAQSIANRLKKTCLDGDGPRIAQELDGLPYLVAKLTGATETETSSLVEAHRINSPWIISNDGLQEEFKTRAGYAKGLPLYWKRIGAALLYFDPNSLLHGVFMANLEGGRIKAPRIVSGFVEAEDVREAASGGVKNNPLDPSGTIQAESYKKNVYGNVPYHRTEYTAARIVVYFNFDLALLDGYGLPLVARELLIALGLYKIRRFLGSGLRLRTACDFEPVGELDVTSPEDFTVPTDTELLTVVKKRIQACRDEGLFHDPPVTELTTPAVLKKDSKEKETTEELAEVATDED